MLPCKIFKDFRLVKNIGICRSLGAYSVYKLFKYNPSTQPYPIRCSFIRSSHGAIIS